MVGEHSVKGDQASLYNLTKSDPDPLVPDFYKSLIRLAHGQICIVSERHSLLSMDGTWNKQLTLAHFRKYDSEGDKQSTQMKKNNISKHTN